MTDLRTARSRRLARLLTIIGWTLLVAGTTSVIGFVPICSALLLAFVHETLHLTVTGVLRFAITVFFAIVFEFVVLMLSLPFIALGRMVASAQDLSLRMYALETALMNGQRVGPRPTRVQAAGTPGPVGAERFTSTVPAADVLHDEPPTAAYGD